MNAETRHRLIESVITAVVLVLLLAFAIFMLGHCSAPDKQILQPSYPDIVVEYEQSPDSTKTKKEPKAKPAKSTRIPRERNYLDESAE